MGEGVIVSTRVSPELKSKLETLAKETHRSEADVANDALVAYVDVSAWQVEEIKRSLAEVQAGAKGVPHEQMAAWLRSWGGKDELPPPEPEDER